MRRWSSCMDFSVLSPDAGDLKVDAVIQDGIAFKARCVMVQFRWLPKVKRALEGANIRVGVVGAFPHGANGQAKWHEANLARNQGADDFDVVWSIADFLSGNYAHVLAELKDVVVVFSNIQNRVMLPGKMFKPLVKVITELGHFAEDEKKLARAALLVKESGADYIKTSTGFGPRTTLEQKIKALKIWRKEVPDLPIKISEGIGSRDDIRALLDAGFDLSRDVVGISKYKEVLEAR